MFSFKHREIKRPDTLLSAVVTALAPTVLILIALTVAMIIPRYATIVTLGGAAVSATVYSLLRRSRTSPRERAGPARPQRHTTTRQEVADAGAHRWPVNTRRPQAAENPLERVR
jgi:hypothetical protein